MAEKNKLSKKLENIVADVEKLTVLELSDLVKALEEKFGVTATAPIAAAPAGAVPVAEGETAKEEKSTYDVILQSAGGNKIGVIKVLRGIKPDLGLKEAKTLSEETPKPILEGAKKEEAEEAKKKLEEVGAKVELK